MSSDTEIFNAVADALIGVGAPAKVKLKVLAATMDNVGVPFMSFQRYLDDPTIVGLFGERGIRQITEEEEKGEDRHS